MDTENINDDSSQPHSFSDQVLIVSNIQIVCFEGAIMTEPEIKKKHQNQKVSFDFLCPDLKHIRRTIQKVNQAPHCGCFS